jgi:hypothetical protein
MMCMCIIQICRHIESIGLRFNRITNSFVYFKLNSMLAESIERKGIGEA